MTKRKICKRFRAGESIAALAAALNLDRPTVEEILRQGLDRKANPKLDIKEATRAR
jgi:hypothetical protein